MSTEAIEKKIDRLNEKVTKALQVPQPETLVKASVIKRLTEWNHEGMRKARNNGYVRRIRKNGIWYILESLNPVFIKNPTV